MTRIACITFCLLGLIVASRPAHTQAQQGGSRPGADAGMQVAPGKGSEARQGSVSYERLLAAPDGGANWLMYSGSYDGGRYSPLDQVHRDNVKGLKLQWVAQLGTVDKVEATPLVVDGVVYLSRPYNGVTALDARTGRPYWRFDYELPEGATKILCCGPVNRGLAILGDRVYMGTLDAHLIALDARNGDLLWDVEVGDMGKGYSITGAPLAVKDMIITGVAGGERGVRGFIDAYDANTGARRWRFHTIPAPGEPGSETWSGEAWRTGGGPTWLTGVFDPDRDLLIWGVGNPAPPFNGKVRPGDNLFTNSAVALDVDTGQMRWYHQFTPHGVHDWDSAQVPVLVDLEWDGRTRPVVLWANRNGFYYILDREDGALLLGEPFVKQTWAKGLDKAGRPILAPDQEPSLDGSVTAPSPIGATNWWPATYSPLTRLHYVPVYDSESIYYEDTEPHYSPGRSYQGGAAKILPRKDDITAVRAIDPRTGKTRWDYRMSSEFMVHTQSGVDVMAGLLATAGNLVFGGSTHGYFFALDAGRGKELWRINLGGRMRAGPVSYAVDGRQYISAIAGGAMFTFALAQ